MNLTMPDDQLERFADLVASRIGHAPRPYLTVAEAAEYLSCKPRRIYELSRQGRLITHRDGTRLLFTYEDLDAVLARDDRQ